MKFVIDHVFAGLSAAEYEAVFFNEPFNEVLANALRLGRKLLRLDRTEQAIVRHVRFEPARDPDAAVNQAYGDSRASFVEELVYDVRERRGDWRTIPNRFAERVTNAGTIEFADVDGGARRIVRGEVRVKLFGFGGRVEKIVVREIEKNYAASAQFTRDYLADRR